MIQRVELYVNDQLLDLPDSDQNPIQQTFQANDIGNLTSIQANYTKQVTIPLTKRNKAILGYPGEIYISSRFNPYNFYPAKLVINGFEIIPNGKLNIFKVTNETADINIMSGNADFLDFLGGQIYDMGDSTSPWSAYGTKLVWKKWDIPVWDVPTAANSQGNTDGWIWPIVNYGDIGTTSPFAGHINVRNIRPAFFLRTAIELLVEFTGYSINMSKSCLYNNPVYAELYKRMLLQFSNSDFEHGTDHQNTPDKQDAMTSVLGTQYVFNPGPTHEGTIPFNQIQYGPVAKNINGTASVLFDIYIKGRATGGNNATIVYVTIIVEQTLTGDSAILAETSFDLSNGSTRLSGSGSSIIAEQTFLNQKLSCDVELVPGMKLTVTYGVHGSPDTTFVIKAGATFTFLPSERNVLWNQSIQCERILPDLSQMDLIKYVLQTFALTLIANPNTGMIAFVSFKQIVANIPMALDWSDKCVDLGKQVDFSLGNYSQINWLRYQQDDAIPLNRMPRFFADDHIDIADKTLNPTQPVQDLFQVPFAPTLNAPYFGGTIAQLSNPTSTDEFSVGSQPRILIDEKLDLRTLGFNSDGSSKTVTFSDNDAGYETVTQTVNDIISVPYFYKSDAPKLSGAARHLCWCDKGGMAGLKTTYYSEFEHILNQTKKVVRYFYLTPKDIYEFDVTIPIFLRQDGAYFYVNKIDSWVAGKPVKVELVRL